MVAANIGCRAPGQQHQEVICRSGVLCTTRIDGTSTHSCTPTSTVQALKLNTLLKIRRLQSQRYKKHCVSCQHWLHLAWAALLRGRMQEWGLCTTRQCHHGLKPHSGILPALSYASSVPRIERKVLHKPFRAQPICYQHNSNVCDQYAR